jgi:HPt (histidine-containing phosphotransfer) domain-containing protein
MITEVIVDQPQDLNEMITEVIVDQPQDLNEMITEVIVDQPQDLNEMITEVIVDQLQDLNEMITEAHTVKKVVNPLSSKRNLEVSKRNLSKNQQKNLLFNLNNFCH